MTESQFSKASSCRKATQFLTAIIFVLMIGKAVANIPLFVNTGLFGALTAADLIKFATQMAALVFVFIFTRHAMNALEGSGSGVSFLRGIAVPLASLIIVAVAQESVRELLNPFLESTGTTLLTVVSSLIILATALWVVFAGYRHAPLLFDFFAAAVRVVRSRFVDNATASLCFNCHSPIDRPANYCPACGTDLKTERCKNCHAQLSPSGKYCGQCGANREE